MKEHNNEMVFVQVKEPDEVRKNILETLKTVLETLQRFERFKHIRHQKLEKIQKLRILLRETNKMFGEVKTKLPQTSLKIPIAKEAPMQAQKQHHKKKKKAKQSEQKMPKKQMTETERLESELNAIESKLKSLT